jgi:hypothetical protein
MIKDRGICRDEPLQAIAGPDGPKRILLRAVLEKIWVKMRSLPSALIWRPCGAKIASGPVRFRPLIGKN